MNEHAQTAGEAGARGPGVRSDCWIRVEPGAGPGCDLTSRVEAFYGESIRARIEEGCAVLEVPDAAVAIEDGGALEWVIDARLEAAVRAAGAGGPEAFLPERRAELREPEPLRFRRSRLYLPGNTPKFMLNAGLHAPDGIILDLEDSVAPARKAEARYLVRNAIRAHDFGPCEIMVRINQLPLGLTDLVAIVPEGPQMILIPKVEDPDQIREVAEKTELLAIEAGVPIPLLMPIIESAKGAWFAYEIASAHDRVAALTIGLEDYTADLGVARTLEGRESFWARSQIVNAARAAGVQAIDTVFSDVDDSEGLRQSVAEARALGFEGKGCIHPRQIEVVHDAFAPAAAEIEQAVRIVRAWEEARERGEGVVALGSKMIDPPVVARAERIVAMAESLGLLTAEKEPAGDRETAETGDADDADREGKV